MPHKKPLKRKYNVMAFPNNSTRGVVVGTYTRKGRCRLAARLWAKSHRGDGNQWDISIVTIHHGRRRASKRKSFWYTTVEWPLWRHSWELKMVYPYKDPLTGLLRKGRKSHKRGESTP